VRCAPLVFGVAGHTTRQVDDGTGMFELCSSVLGICTTREKDLPLVLGPRWADADSETLRSHVRTHGIVLREKYRHLFRDAAVGPYVAVSYQWKALLGDILDQVNGALEMGRSKW